MYCCCGYHTAISGVHVRAGCRQSIPSSNIDSCARVSETVPDSAFGQTNFPRSKRFENRQSPSPSNHSNLMRSPRRPRKTNTCPPNGSCSSTVCTAAPRPVKPRRRSVMPAAIQTCSGRRSNHPARHSNIARSTVPSATPSILTRALANLM